MSASTNEDTASGVAILSMFCYDYLDELRALIFGPRIVFSKDDLRDESPIVAYIVEILQQAGHKIVPAGSWDNSPCDAEAIVSDLEVVAWRAGELTTVSISDPDLAAKILAAVDKATKIYVADYSEC